jgi:hypothetical protein
MLSRNDGLRRSENESIGSTHDYRKRKRKREEFSLFKGYQDFTVSMA